MSQDKQNLLKILPGVDRVLEDTRIQRLTEKYPRALVVETIRQILNEIRNQILGNHIESPKNEKSVLNDLIPRLEYMLQPGLRRAVNAMGIILHTGLGRAPLPESAQKNLMDVIAHYSTLQIDSETGKRGDRYRTVEKLLIQITGAEAGLVVNNNAAATLLILNTLAEGKEVIVSRGELVEIGGSFRIPDVMKRSGATLKEIGTTNRTHLKDYQNAITEETGCILKVHQSNYKMIGFTKQITIKELAPLARAHQLPLVDDLGSGALVDLSKWNLPKEPTVQDSVSHGADVTCFSGDKLIGGPQCGIIVGKKEIIDRMKKNPLTRALRCGKMTYAILEATLRLFIDEELLQNSHPVIKMLTEPVDQVKKRAQRLKRRLHDILGDNGIIEVRQDVSEVGSGSLAGYSLATWVVAIKSIHLSAENLAKNLRLSNPPIFCRVKGNQVLLDCSTIRKDELPMIQKAFKTVLTI